MAASARPTTPPRPGVVEDRNPSKPANNRPTPNVGSVCSYVLRDHMHGTGLRSPSPTTPDDFLAPTRSSSTGSLGFDGGAASSWGPSALVLEEDSEVPTGGRRPHHARFVRSGYHWEEVVIDMPSSSRPIWPTIRSRSEDFLSQVDPELDSSSRRAAPGTQLQGRRSERCVSV